jgi:hypothetical protein
MGAYMPILVGMCVKVGSITQLLLIHAVWQLRMNDRTNEA